ncbi:MAG: type I restriction endonuclease subunit R, partial [Planctomycetes bacterium]|nr:type I restriction endonuclease subunit R [Planctomycetota bacterium]
MTESAVEQTALDWLIDLGYEVAHGPDISPGGPSPERDNYQDVVLVRRLRESLERINPDMPAEAMDEAVRRISQAESPSLVENNRCFHRLLSDGVDVECRDKDGRIQHEKVWLVDASEPENNDWLAVNQFTVEEGRNTRRPDILIFVNGLPLAVIELKNPADEKATVLTAFRQFQTYKQEIPGLFRFNEMLVAADGMQARAGTLTSEWEWFLPWRTIEGTELYREPGNEKQTEGELRPGLEVLIPGMFEKRRFLDLVLNFVVFEDDGATVAKKLAIYHQYHAVNKAVDSTLEAASPEGDRRIGVVWHTQGSGKSLSMVFYSGKIVRHPEMENPTLVVITDRNDLDGQLHGTFSRCRELLRQTPAQAESREHLRKLLEVPAGGVVFTTIQKFFPEEGEAEHPLLSERENIVVIADEAHRSQYGFIDGFARHMHDALPNASFIG